MKTCRHSASSCSPETAPPHAGITHLAMASAVAKGEPSDARKTAVHRGDGVALWRKIEQVFAAEIALLPPGDRRLSSEQELAQRLDVHRHTVRQAVRAFRAGPAS